MAHVSNNCKLIKIQITHLKQRLNPLKNLGKRLELLSKDSATELSPSVPRLIATAREERK